MTYHPYMPSAGGICGVCQSPAMSPQHVAGYVPPAPAPIIAPDPIPSAAQPVQPVPPQPTSADATTGPVQGDLIPPEQQTPEERAEVAEMAGKVELAFPTIGFIDPVAELEKMLRIVQGMPQDLKLAYPDKIRAAILAHEAGKGPEVSDEDLALAIFIQRTYATPLTEEELEAKATGRKKRDPDAAAKKVPKSKQSSVDQLKGMF